MWHHSSCSVPWHHMQCDHPSCAPEIMSSSWRTISSQTMKQHSPSLGGLYQIFCPSNEKSNVNIHSLGSKVNPSVQQNDKKGRVVWSQSIVLWSCFTVMPHSNHEPILLSAAVFLLVICSSWIKSLASQVDNGSHCPLPCHLWWLKICIGGPVGEDLKVTGKRAWRY